MDRMAIEMKQLFAKANVALGVDIIAS